MDRTTSPGGRDYFLMAERTTSFGSALPGRCCCFYGYFILFWTICVGLAQGLGAQLLFNITVPRMYDAFEAGGVSRTSFSTYWMVGTFMAAAAAPFCGQLIDRFGARICIPVGLCLMAASSTGISLVPFTMPWLLIPVRAQTLCATSGLRSPV